jgi:prepilin-type N-terminal cleavage/methylation domain-containing protein
MQTRATQRSIASVSTSAARRGLSLVEVVVVMAILTVAAGIFAQTMSAASRMDPLTLENNLAAEGARVTLERMKATEFEQLFASFNADPNDDPGGVGTAPGATFAVPGLAPSAVGGSVGVIEFPTIGNQLREDVIDAALVMPRDLNGDGLVDGANHAADYAILPIRIRVTWSSRYGRAGVRTLDTYAMYSPL